jgi:hypothetical protein
MSTANIGHDAHVAPGVIPQYPKGPSMTSELPFIDPTAGGSKLRIALAARPIDLAGKVVGLLDNTKEQADIILDAVGAALRERYGVARVVSRRKEFFSRPATPALIDEIAQDVQVAVAALGG